MILRHIERKKRLSRRSGCVIDLTKVKKGFIKPQIATDGKKGRSASARFLPHTDFFEKAIKR
jgi:hypothetical protein